MASLYKYRDTTNRQIYYRHLNYYFQAAVTTHSELKARYDAEVTQLRFDLREKNNQIHHYGQKAQKLEVSIEHI